MKRTALNSIAIVMVVMLFLQTNYLLVFYGLFQLNRKALTEEVCEKKVEGCNACCYLNKKMNEDEQNSQTAPDPVRKPATKENIKLSEYVVNFINLANISYNDLLNYTRISESLYSSGYFGSIDHPPKA
ncbi:MAG: hypothetical protein KDC73_02305 [Ignavibacteriae bacterium]|nr:hypothetical protein [Ignavibacteriota bacterium]MCB9244448.1 hypothetical protein [Ignavibacteriales bacterium]